MLALEVSSLTITIRFILLLRFALLPLTKPLASFDRPLGAPGLGADLHSPPAAALALSVHPPCCRAVCSAGQAIGARGVGVGAGGGRVLPRWVAWQGVVVLHQPQQQLLHKRACSQCFPSLSSSVMVTHYQIHQGTTGPLETNGSPTSFAHSKVYQVVNLSGLPTCHFLSEWGCPNNSSALANSSSRVAQTMYMQLMPRVLV